MASIGRVAVQAASVAQETTLALSNINFDFSLVRMEAPLEYRGLGALLSSKRKREAEDGSIHITARKLGALFNSDLPPIPNLTRAYGRRVSEIAENPQFNPRSNPSYGPFGDYVGADATSIWAAATSGPGALAVQLLACLLARMWTGPQATSIWSELVAARKAALQSRLEDQEFPISLVTASQIEVERHKLLEWDGSARSVSLEPLASIKNSCQVRIALVFVLIKFLKWIRTADSAKKTQQTQLMLIIDNLDLPISRNVGVYSDVMSAWTQALTTVENLVSGVAQRVNTGEALLGLSAWHIYPDICAEGQKTTIVEQNDNLVTKGGVVTLGLQEHRGRSSMGISWSMPLAHLRYYGGAVSSHRTVGSKNSKVSFDSIVLVALGSAMTMWDNRDTQIDGAMRFFIAFANILEFAHYYRAQRLHWPKLLADQARQVLSCDRVGRQEMARLVALGLRRYGIFLAADKEHPPPLFGLSNPSECIRLLHMPDQAITTIRGMSKCIPTSLEGAITRHAYPDFGRFKMIEYASISPAQKVGETTYQIHHRWLTMPDTWNNDKSISMVLDRATYIKEKLGEPCGLLESDELFAELESDTHPRLIAAGTKKRLGFWADLHNRCVEELLPYRDTVEGLKQDHDQFFDSIECAYLGRSYELYLGDIGTRMHVYVLRRLPGIDPSQIILPVDIVTNALETQVAELSKIPTRFDGPTLGCEIYESDRLSYYDPFYKSLSALAKA